MDFSANKLSELLGKPSDLNTQGPLLHFENLGTSAVDCYQWSVITCVIILVLFLKVNKRHPQPLKALILLAKEIKDKEDGNV